MFESRELDRLIRSSEIAGVRAGIAATHRLRPDIGAAAFEACGGLAAFTGIDSPLTQGYGIGCDAEPSRDDVERIDAFFASRGATPAIFVTPFTRLSLTRALVALRYVPAEYVSVFVCDLREEAGRRDDRVVESRDNAEWAAASIAAFHDNASPKPGDDLIARVVATSEGVVTLEARDGGVIAATGGLDVRGDIAAVFGGSTLPAFRNRGWQLTLLRDRLARARERGARLARGSARAGSGSERNFLRAGFRTLYTSALWTRT